MKVLEVATLELHDAHRAGYSLRYSAARRRLLPAIVEADDCGLYVLKFRGAGQGPLALVAEVVAGELGRVLGLPVPELVFVELDAAIGRNEPDEEIRDLLSASAGLNLALDYLPGSLMFNVAAGDRADAELASRIVWFDSLVTNVDRTVRNPNLLLWHRRLQLIDHGAALYFHHNWPGTDAEIRTAAQAGFSAIRSHILLPWASSVLDAGKDCRGKLSEDVIASVVAQIPHEWLPAPVTHGGYLRFLNERLAAAQIWEGEAIQAYAAQFV